MPKISEYTDCDYESFGSFGRALYKYTGCGPWVVAVLLDGREIYCEDKEAWKLPMETEVQYLRVGSIVEGSDVDVGPFDVEDPKEFWGTVKQIDEECDFYWKRDNLDHFYLRRNGDIIGYITCGWGEFELELDGNRILKRDREALKTFCTHGDYCRPDEKFEGAVIVPEPGEVFKVPGTKLEIQFFEDDSSLY